MLHFFGFSLKPFARSGVAIAMLAAAGHLPASGAEKVLHRFKYSDGSLPSSELIADGNGNVYGTTQRGGDPQCSCGTVFKLAPDGTESVLHTFAGGSDGGYPFGGLLMDGSGNLFGTTSGYFGSVGTVFEIATDGTETILHVFKNAADGRFPFSTLIADKSGNLYGTTELGGGTGCGGDGCGTVFKVASSGTETVFYAFQGAPDGAFPVGGLVLDNNGNLVGTTYSGGAVGGANCSIDPHGCGTVFQITPAGTETVVYNFHGGSDGIAPRGTLLADKSGNLYGTTEYGGSCNSNSICGTVFKLAPDGTETVLYRFLGGNDGASPYAGVIADKSGNLYGTTYVGGGGCEDIYGCGTVFKLAADGTETVLQNFVLLRHGKSPGGALLKDKGILYGTTVSGGYYKNGVVFAVRTQ